MLVCVRRGADGAGGRVEAARPRLARQPAPAAYARRARRARSAPGRDVWGDELLARRGGPTYDAARRYLTPLLFARAAGRTPLTASGVYYLPFGVPAGARGATLGRAPRRRRQPDRLAPDRRRLAHRARRPGRRASGTARASRGSRAASLADGWLPILETGYADAAGARYRQESFATHAPGTDALVSFVRIDVDARRARAAVTVRLTASPGAAAQLRVGAGGRRDGASATFRVPRGTTRTLYAAWLVRRRRRRTSARPGGVRGRARVGRRVLARAARRAG